MKPGFYFEKGHLYGELSDDCIRLYEQLSSEPPENGVEGFLLLVALGGAMEDLPVESTAFEYRHAKYWALFIATWKSPEQRESAVAWVRKVHGAFKQFAVGTYAPVIGAEGEEDPTGLAFNSNLGRLVELKRKYDPNNFFKNNRNINPNQ